MKYEFRRAKNRSGSPVLLSPDEFTGRAGFISMFGFNDQAEEFIASGRSTAGVDRFPLYSDRLYVEFDDNAAAEDKAINKLKELGYKFCVYHTGNRGHHIHIPITPVERTGLHHYMKAVATAMFKGCDEGIYKATGIIRIPGTVHASTGNKMVKVYEHDGKVMDIDDHRPRSYVPVKRVQEVDKDFRRTTPVF